MIEQTIENWHRQLRGELPKELTVEGAKVALATNGGSGALFTDVMLLGKELM